MKVVVFGFVAACAAGMLWLFLQPVCQGGHIVANAAECAQHFSAGFCNNAFSRTTSIAARSGPTYNSDNECRDSWPVCDRREPQGYGPRPSHWCLVEASGGTAARIEPQFNNRRQ